MKLLATSLDAVKPSPTLEITKKAAQLRREGVDVIGLAQGEPDFPTPEHIVAAAKDAIDQGLTKYTDVDGTPELKAAVARKFKRENGLEYEQNQISVGTGGKQVIFNALRASLNAGDEVIIPAPYWVSYPDMVLIAGGSPVELLCPLEQGYKLSARQLRSAITPKTKWLILNSPSNPTGAGYSRDELVALASVLVDHPHVHVLTDDMYEHLRYDGWEFNTLASVEPRLYGRTLTVNGVSKAYSMTGWRIGYAGGPQELINAMAKIQSQSTSNPCSISQYAATAALDGPLDFLSERNDVFRERRDLCLENFNSIDGLECRKPEGAFYLFPSCQGWIGRDTPGGARLDDDMAVARYLLEQARVAVVPGSAFGAEGHFRISFATSTERLRDACVRVRLASQQLN
jgi:aspartate aminotransferase